MSQMPKDERAEYDLNRYHEQRSKGISILGGCCVVCGSVEDLQFDHIDPNTKLFNLSKEWGRSDWFEELEKCQLLCWPCHKDKTSKDRPEPPHGAWGQVKRKCKCDECRSFVNAYMAEYKRRRKG